MKKKIRLFRNNSRNIYASTLKGITRKVYSREYPIEINEKYYDYQSSKAKRFLRMFNDQYRNGITENLEKAHLKAAAIRIHHIFPECLKRQMTAGRGDLYGRINCKEFCDELRQIAINRGL